MEYTTGVRLGERYRDDQTGIEGVAVTLSFFQYGCERVTLEWRDGQDIKEAGFDAPRLTLISTEEKVETTRTGGPQRGVSHKRPGPASR